MIISVAKDEIPMGPSESAPVVKMRSNTSAEYRKKAVSIMNSQIEEPNRKLKTHSENVIRLLPAIIYTS